MLAGVKDQRNDVTERCDVDVVTRSRREWFFDFLVSCYFLTLALHIC